MPGKSDQQLAQDIRDAAQALRDAVVAARTSGLEVDIPIMLDNWLGTGHAPGDLSAWTIRRRSL